LKKPAYAIHPKNRNSFKMYFEGVSVLLDEVF
jgi:hypothetical protein